MGEDAPWERRHLACSVNNRETVSTLEACAPRKVFICGFEPGQFSHGSERLQGIRRSTNDHEGHIVGPRSARQKSLEILQAGGSQSLRRQSRSTVQKVANPLG